MQEQLPSTRKAAKVAGSVRYFTGKVCKNGHLSERRTDDGHCVMCVNDRAARRWKENPEHVRRLANEWRKSNPDRVKASKQRYYQSNKEFISKRSRERYASDPDFRAKRRANTTAWALANPERKKAADREWVLANRDRHNAQGKRWRLNNLEKSRAAARAQYRADPEVRRASVKRWLAKNPHKIKEYNSARRARVINAEGRFTDQDFEAICLRQKGRCAACKKKGKLTADHIVALSKGGSNRPSNIQGLCLSCNSQKHARDLMEFMRTTQGLLL